MCALTKMVCHPRFNQLDVQRDTVRKLQDLINGLDSNESSPLGIGWGWKNSSIVLSIPRRKIPRNPKVPPPVNFLVPGLRHHSIIHVLHAALEQYRAPHEQLHYTPFKEYVQLPGSEDSDHYERIYSEVYTSNAMIQEDAAIQALPPEDDDLGVPLPRAVAALMFWSDATQLANFGSAKLWPLYLFLGNLSKWTRGKATSRECYHIAYFNSVSRLLPSEPLLKANVK